jgi:hypothetical protein
MTTEQLRGLVEAHQRAFVNRPPPRPYAPAPRSEWPFVVRVLAARRQDGEAGVGDTAKRLLHRMGADGLAWLYEKATGRDCGCANRQERLNRLYPY